MKILCSLFLCFLVTQLAGCTKGNQINGRSLKTANRSASYIKNRLPTEKRVEFEISFWSLRDEIKDKDAFLESIDGKTPEELIEMGKELFNKRKQVGFTEYQKFSSWEQMIATYTQERIDQDRKPDMKDRRQPTVLYNF